MRKLESDDMGVKIDGRQLHHLRFADDIVLITPSISQAERMLTEFDETCGCIGLQLHFNHWTRAVSDWVPRDIKRTRGRPPTRWSYFFTKSFKENYDALCIPRERRNHWATLARNRDKWKNYWRPVRRSTGVKMIKVT
ncbi:hypothetical protein RB195_023560 [Necator americanus]|uniref:Reverse transcriptase domain-containing protein n=1 Tax=Necator americanus TaxID=51031 RepID=A0ABR1EKK5_NECAM